MEECLKDIIARHWLDLYTYRADPLRLCFILTQTPYWLYEDIGMEKYHACKLNEQDFCRHIFARCDFLAQYVYEFRKIYDEFNLYQKVVPTYGAVLLNKKMNKLVLPTGYKSKCRGFPKGKINEGETEIQCAAREVYEEVGIDVSGLMNESEYIFIEGVDVRYLKLFVVAGLDEKIHMKPTVYKEVRDVQFYPIRDLERIRWSKTNLSNQVRQLIGPIIKWVPEKAIKVEITTSQETDPDISNLEGEGILLIRGLVAQYIKKHYLKAKKYYKDAILASRDAEDAVECWLNKMLTNCEPLSKALKYLKKHKSIWNGRLREYHLIKETLKKSYTTLSNLHEGTLNLIEIPWISRNEKWYPWEDTELYIRRLLRYDHAIIRVFEMYDPKNWTKQRDTRNYSTKWSEDKYVVYLAEVAHDAKLCKVANNSNLPFKLIFLSPDKVNVDGKKYFNWLENAYPKSSTLKEDLYWSNKLMASISTRIFKDIDFTQLQHERSKKVEQGTEVQSKASLEFGTWENFRLNTEKIMAIWN